MKALIDPTQNNRIIEVREEEFEVANPYFWKKCSNDVTPYSHLYVNGKFVEFDVNKIMEEISSDNSLLSSYKQKLLEDPRYDFSHLNDKTFNKCC